MNKNRQRVAVYLRFLRALKSQRGFSLLEILVALGILAATAVVFLAGMETSSKAVLISQERITADSLAKSQIEAIKTWEYDDDNQPPNYDAAKLAETDDYFITISALRWDPKTNTESADDTGLQKITVTIKTKSDGEKVFELVGYKVDR